MISWTGELGIGTVWGSDEHLVQVRDGAVQSICNFRYKATIGDRPRARHPESQTAETIIACKGLNRMAGFGRPESFEIAG